MTEYQEFKMDLPKETKEVGDALASLLSATAVALADGWQPGTDLPAILVAPITHLGTALEGIQKVPGEFLEAPVRAAMAIVAPLAESADALLQSLRK